MKRALMLVEGQTEEAFVNGVLAPHLERYDLYVACTLICTKRVHGQRRFRGGTGATYRHIRRDLRNLLRDTSVVAVTTLIDFYHLPPDFPGAESLPDGPAMIRAEHLERSFRDDLGDPRFIPNLIVHEFEALLFSDPTEIQRAFPGEPRAKELQAIADAFSSPELINEGETTSPSKRLERLFPSYDKVLHGALIAERLGIGVIRERCPRFARWLAALEVL
jgi:hypothetical protein